MADVVNFFAYGELINEDIFKDYRIEPKAPTAPPAEEAAPAEEENTN